MTHLEKNRCPVGLEKLRNRGRRAESIRLERQRQAARAINAFTR